VLTTRIATILRGKHKVSYSPNMDCGDKVIVINARKIFLTGKKYHDDVMYYHTGYPGSVKARTMRDRLEGKRPEDVLRRCVEHMIPKGPLRERQMRSLYVYADADHAQSAQKPKVLDVSEIKREQ